MSCKYLEMQLERRIDHFRKQNNFEIQINNKSHQSHTGWWERLQSLLHYPLQCISTCWNKYVFHFFKTKTYRKNLENLKFAKFEFWNCLSNKFVKLMYLKMLINFHESLVFCNERFFFCWIPIQNFPGHPVPKVSRLYNIYRK